MGRREERTVGVGDAYARRLQRHIEACVEGLHGGILPVQLSPVGTIPPPPGNETRLRHLNAQWFKNLTDTHEEMET